jgi:hypothetical protein
MKDIRPSESVPADLERNPIVLPADTREATGRFLERERQVEKTRRAVNRPNHQMTPAEADLLDQYWLDSRIDSIDSGIEAVVDIAQNWGAGRNLQRLHPSVSGADYVRDHVGPLTRDVIGALLLKSNWSNRQIAKVAGVSEGTVRNVSGAQDYAPDRDEVLGADGKTYSTDVVRHAPTPHPDPVTEDTDFESNLNKPKRWGAALTNLRRVATARARQSDADMVKTVDGLVHLIVEIADCRGLKERVAFLEETCSRWEWTSDD